MKSNRAKIEQQMRDAMKEGLNQAAQLYVNAMKVAMRGGYTSGDFVTGNAMNSITRTPVEQDGNDFAVRVGSNVDYMIYWEIGHHNLFTRKFERVEKWGPTLHAQLGNMQQAIRNAFKRIP